MIKTNLLLGALVLQLGLTSCFASTEAPPSAPPPAPAPERPTATAREAVVNIMERVCDWQIANPSKWTPSGWHQAAYYTGAMALSRISSSPRFHDAMMQMSERNNWQLEKRPYHADDHCVGQTYAELYFIHRDPKMIAPLRERFDYILAHPKDDNLEFVGKEKTDRWSWCDALFMGPPTWLRLWMATGEKKYLDYMVTHWWKTSAYLYDNEEHLYFRDSTLFNKREANGKKIFWSRGNGWVLGGLARIIPHLPADLPERGRFIEQFQQMATRVASLQPADGLWRASLLDPDSYPTKESSGSAFNTFAIAWGINEGFLDRAKYEPIVMKSWQALVECVQPDGKLTHVQPVGFTPEKNFDENSTEVYGVGAFLLAGSEVYRLLGGKAAPAAPNTAHAAAK